MDASALRQAYIVAIVWTLHSTRRLHPFRRDGCCLLQVPCTAGILAAAERWGRRGALLLVLLLILPKTGGGAGGFGRLFAKRSFTVQVIFSLAPWSHN